MDPRELETYLAALRIEFRAIDHPPVFTCEEASRYITDAPGVATKNLFVESSAERALFLVVVSEKKRVDLKALSKLLGVKKLSFASDESLQEVLGLTPGSVTMLAVVNDTARRVRLVIDSAVWGSEPLQCHPLVNTRTLFIAPQELEKLFLSTGHKAEIIEIPEKIL